MSDTERNLLDKNEVCLSNSSDYSKTVHITSMINSLDKNSINYQTEKGKNLENFCHTSEKQFGVKKCQDIENNAGQTASLKNNSNSYRYVDETWAGKDEKILSSKKGGENVESSNVLFKSCIGEKNFKESAENESKVRVPQSNLPEKYHNILDASLVSFEKDERENNNKDDTYIEVDASPNGIEVKASSKNCGKHRDVGIKDFSEKNLDECGSKELDGNNITEFLSKTDVSKNQEYSETEIHKCVSETSKRDPVMSSSEKDENDIEGKKITVNDSNKQDTLNCRIENVVSVRDKYSDLARILAKKSAEDEFSDQERQADLIGNDEDARSKENDSCDELPENYEHLIPEVHIKTEADDHDMDENGFELADENDYSKTESCSVVLKKLSPKLEVDTMEYFDPAVSSPTKLNFKFRKLLKTKKEKKSKWMTQIHDSTLTLKSLKKTSGKKPKSIPKSTLKKSKKAPPVFKPCVKKPKKVSTKSHKKTKMLTSDDPEKVRIIRVPSKKSLYSKKKPKKKQKMCKECDFTSVSTVVINKHTFKVHVKPNLSEDILATEIKLTKGGTLKKVEYENCPVCDKRIEKSRMPIHMHIHTGGFSCDQCDFKSFSKSSLKNHKTSNHSVNSFTCGACEFSTVYKCLLEEHLEKEHEGKAFKCNLCDFSTKRANALSGHLKTHDKKFQTEDSDSDGEQDKDFMAFVCNDCNYKGVSKKGYEKHMKTHEKEYYLSDEEIKAENEDNEKVENRGRKNKLKKVCKKVKREKKVKVKEVTKKLKCTHCGLRYSTEEDMDAHIAKKHFLKNCPQCEYTCHTVREFKTHFRTAHVPFKCKECDHRSTSRPALTRHMRIAHCKLNLYECDYCPFKSDKLDKLRGHTRCHTGEKPYKCKHCSYETARRRTLVLHERTHTGEKKYKCNLCPYECTRMDYLKGHFRTHTGEKPYPCTECDFRATSRTNLKGHMKSHTGPKPYICFRCNFATGLASSLEQHIKSHENKFTCQFCGYASVNRGSFATHLRAHSELLPFKCFHCGFFTHEVISFATHLEECGREGPPQDAIVKKDYKLQAPKPERKNKKANKRKGKKKDSVDTATNDETVNDSKDPPPMDSLDFWKKKFEDLEKNYEKLKRNYENSQNVFINQKTQDPKRGRVNDMPLPEPPLLKLVHKGVTPKKRRFSNKSVNSSSLHMSENDYLQQTPSNIEINYPHPYEHFSSNKVTHTSTSKSSSISEEAAHASAQSISRNYLLSQVRHELEEPISPHTQSPILNSAKVMSKARNSGNLPPMRNNVNLSQVRNNSSLSQVRNNSNLSQIRNNANLSHVRNHGNLSHMSSSAYYMPPIDTDPESPASTSSLSDLQNDISNSAINLTNPGTFSPGAAQNKKDNSGYIPQLATVNIPNTASLGNVLYAGSSSSSNPNLNHVIQSQNNSAFSDFRPNLFQNSQTGYVLPHTVWSTAGPSNVQEVTEMVDFPSLAFGSSHQPNINLAQLFKR